MQAKKINNKENEAENKELEKWVLHLQLGNAFDGSEEDAWDKVKEDGSALETLLNTEYFGSGLEYQFLGFEIRKSGSPIFKSDPIVEESPEVWFSVVKWPEWDCDEDRTVEIAHYASKEVCERSLKEYLLGNFDGMELTTIEEVLVEGVKRGFHVYYAKAKTTKK